MSRVKAYAAWVGQFAVKGLAVAGLILAAAAVWQLTRGHWDTERFAASAVNLGFVVTGIGALFGVGRGLGLGTNPQYQVARTAGAATGEERARQDFAAGQPPVPFMLVVITGGILAMVIGFVL
jgi:hypothetical protein